MQEHPYRSNDPGNVEFMKWQQRYLSELREIKARKDSGENCDLSEIRRRLVASGIYDESGNLMPPYSGER